MNQVNELGKLTRVEDLHSVWDTEHRKFTPWLANNLTILGETLGIDLEFDSKEKAIGNFRADIICRDVGTKTWVLIENQLEKTDHNHLGQLLTYASGLEATKIIWIASEFREEHRSTLDWLNRITDDRIHFFGLEVELWRIGNSPCAPKFNIVARPNAWSCSTAQTICDGNSNANTFHLNYWTAFFSVFHKTKCRVSGNAGPTVHSVITFPSGRASFLFQVAIARKRKDIRAELYISGDDAKALFQRLEMKKKEIEQELEEELEWNNMLGCRDSRISIVNCGVDPEDKEDWQHQHEWLILRLNDLHRVFSSRIEEL